MPMGGAGAKRKRSPPPRRDWNPHEEQESAAEDHRQEQEQRREVQNQARKHEADRVQEILIQSIARHFDGEGVACMLRRFLGESGSPPQAQLADWLCLSTADITRMKDPSGQTAQQPLTARRKLEGLVKVSEFIAGAKDPRLLRLIQKMEETDLDVTQLFRKPVVPDRKERFMENASFYVAYEQVIEKPMDLTTLTRDLGGRRIQTDEQFCEAASLMFYDCIGFNEPGVLRQFAETMLEWLHASELAEAAGEPEDGTAGEDSVRQAAALQPTVADVAPPVVWPSLRPRPPRNDEAWSRFARLRDERTQTTPPSE
jgi:hypothetical protein